MHHKKDFNMYNPVKETKSFCKDLDAILQDMKVELAISNNQTVPTRKSRERSIAITKLQEAIMWLGMDLKAMNEEGIANIENPYPDSYNPNNDKVAPTTDNLKL